MFSVLPKVMFSVLPKVSVQSVRSVWFLDVAWSDAFGVALSDAGTWLSYFSEGVKHVETTNQIMNMGLIDPNKRWTSDCSWSFHVISKGNLHKSGCKKCACLARSTDADEARPCHFFPRRDPKQLEKNGCSSRGLQYQLVVHESQEIIWISYIPVFGENYKVNSSDYRSLSTYFILFPQRGGRNRSTMWSNMFVVSAWGGQSRDNLFDMFDMFDQYLDFQFRHGNRVFFMYLSECVNPFINQIN